MVAAKVLRHEKSPNKLSKKMMAERFSIEILQTLKIYVQPQPEIFARLPSVAKTYILRDFRHRVQLKKSRRAGTLNHSERKPAPIRWLPAPFHSANMRVPLTPASQFLSHFQKPATVTMLVPDIIGLFWEKSPSLPLRNGAASVGSLVALPYPIPKIFFGCTKLPAVTCV
jgi:hypothetical protein